MKWIEIKRATIFDRRILLLSNIDDLGYENIRYENGALHISMKGKYNVITDGFKYLDINGFNFKQLGYKLDCLVSENKKRLDIEFNHLKNLISFNEHYNVIDENVKYELTRYFLHNLSGITKMRIVSANIENLDTKIMLGSLAYFWARFEFSRLYAMHQH